MDILMAVLYGVVQGLTEFLPISSTAHLRILPSVFGQPDPGAGFTAVIQLGTLFAVLIYFFKDLCKAITGWALSIVGKVSKDSPDARLGWGVFWGTMPIIILGFLFKDQIKSNEFRSLYVICGALVGMGILMLYAERCGKKDRQLEDSKLIDGIIVGLWQCVALIPGASRSGSTITGALFAGFDRPAAARYSFLLSVPSITAAGLYELYDERKEIFGASFVPAMVATVVSFVVGYWAISFLIKFLAKHGIGVFVGYRFLLAIVLMVLLQTGVLQPESGAESSPTGEAAGMRAGSP